MHITNGIHSLLFSSSNLLLTLSEYPIFIYFEKMDLLKYKLRPYYLHSFIIPLFLLFSFNISYNIKFSNLLLLEYLSNSKINSLFSINSF